MVQAVTPTLVGTNLDATWLVDTTQNLQTVLENNQQAHFWTANIVCGATAFYARNPVLFAKCQAFVNGLLAVPSYIQGITVEPKYGTLYKTTDAIFKNMIVTPLSTFKDLSGRSITWIADNSFALNNWINENLYPLFPVATIGLMVKSVMATNVKKEGLAVKYGWAPLSAAVMTHLSFMMPAIAKSLVGSDDSKESSIVGKGASILANTWVKTGQGIAAVFNWAIEGCKSNWKKIAG